MAFRVLPTPFAATQIRREGRWWRRNRTKAPKLFRSELRRAFQLIAEFPEAGALSQDFDLAGVRRVLLFATQHYLYYRIDEVNERVEVLALSSTSREHPPQIPPV